jgi:hypothetical protein
MKHAAFLLGVMLIFTATAGAQVSSNLSLTQATSVSSTAPTPQAPPLFAFAATSDATPVGGAAQGTAAPGAQDNTPPPVFGVFQNYNWQATAGYTFFRFYLSPHPSIVEDMNGLHLGIVWYPHGKWVGADGDFTAAWGSFDRFSSKFALAMGGPRFRWAAPRGLEIWAHGLVGGAHILPQTPFGNQGAFAYDVGGGVDIGIHQRRLAYRVQADMVGTHFFNTYQYSPKIAVGIVFKY